MKRYLRLYVDFNQENWASLLASAEFAANAAVSESTQLSSFMATRGYQPRISFDEAKPAKTARERVVLARARNLAKPIEKAWAWAQDRLKKTQKQQQTQANKHRREIDFEEGDKVWLSMKNISTTRPCKKLDSKWIGPFPVVRRLGQSFRLQLPPSMRIHNVFHASLLTKDPADPLPGQEYPEPLPVETEDGEEWEAEEIVDVKHVGRALKARVKWVGWPEDLTYYPIRNFENLRELLRDYFERHPTKEAPEWLFIN